MGRVIDADDFMRKCREIYENEEWDKREVHFSLLDIEFNINNSCLPEQEDTKELKMMCEELKAAVEHYRREKEQLNGQIRALAFAVRCNGISGNEVRYE